MNEQLRNIGNEYLYQNINYLSNVSYEISNEIELLHYIKDKGDYYGWKTELFDNKHLLLINQRDESKKNIVICTYFDLCDENSNIDYKGLSVIENKIYTERTKLKANNIFNISQILSIISKQYETNFDWELLNDEYNIMILISQNKENLPSELLSKLNCEKTMICIQGEDANLLEITQMNNSTFEITKEIEFVERNYNNGFCIKMDILFLNNYKSKYEKEEFNSLAYNLDLVLNLQEKFKIEILDIKNNSKLNDRKYFSEITISSEEEKITPIMQYIKAYHESLNEKLKLNDVCLQIELKRSKLSDFRRAIKVEYIKKIEGIMQNKFKQLKDDNILNFGELYIDDLKEIFYIKGLIKGKNIGELEDLKNKLIHYCEKQDLSIIYLNEIPLWGIDRDDIFRKKAIRIYRSLNNKQNKIKTVSKSNYMNIIENNNKNTQCFSYIYKIYKDEGEREYVKATEITKLWSSLGGLLDEFLSDEVKENFYLNTCEKFKEDDDIN